MKKSILTVAMLVAVMSVKAQTIKMADTENIEVTSQLTNGEKFNTLVFKDGSQVSVGDTLVLGKPFNGSKDFDRVMFGQYNVAKAIVLGPPVYMSQNSSGAKVVVTDIFPYHTKFTRNSPVDVVLYVSEAGASNFGGASNRTIWDVESALNTGELINPKRAMTRDEAIATLKQQKDLLDLGMITQDKFDAKKAELSSIILN